MIPACKILQHGIQVLIPDTAEPLSGPGRIQMTGVHRSLSGPALP